VIVTDAALLQIAQAAPGVRTDLERRLARWLLETRAASRKVGEELGAAKAVIRVLTTDQEQMLAELSKLRKATARG
jgi:hypothetical protein